MLSLSQFQAEVERLSSDCSFLFDDSYSEQICWTHCSSCPATSTTAQRFERCTCTAGIMTRKQMETFEHNLREHTESGKEGNATSLKVSNVPALSFIASFLGTQCGAREDRPSYRTHGVKNPGTPKLATAATLATSAEYRKVNNSCRAPMNQPFTLQESNSLV
jgi:hypothetical protein